MKKLIDFVTSRLTAQQNQMIANVLMFIGVAIDLYDMMQNGFAMNLLPILLAIGFVGIGFAYQQLFVRCPHCGDKLKGHKHSAKLPDRCPNCNQKLDTLPQK